MIWSRSPLWLLPLAIACASGGDDTAEPADDPPLPDGPLQYAPVVPFDGLHFEGFPVRYHVPANPKGVVWAFHGANGDVNYVTRIETVALLNELILTDFAFVGTESADRTRKQWDTTEGPSNEDLARLFRLHDHLVQAVGLPDGLPQFTFGFSNGGAMACVFAKAGLDRGLDVRAVAPHHSPGQPWGLDLPILWSLAINDPFPSAEQEYARRHAEGLPVALHVVPEQLLTAAYFERNPGLGPGPAQKTVDDLVRIGLIDETGARIPPIDEAEDWISRFERQATVASPTLRSDDIRVGWALHRMNGFYAREVRDFFLQFR